MRYQRWLAACCLTFGMIFGGCRSGNGGGAAETTPETPTRVTAWTDSTELFLEYPAMVVGQPTRFAIHLTRLADFRPVATGAVVLRFRPRAGGLPVDVRSEAPRSPGIYGPTVSMEVAGTYDLDVILEDARSGDSLHVPGVIVYDDPDDIPLLPPPSGGIVFLKEQQWSTVGLRTAHAIGGSLPATLEVSGEVIAAAGRQAVVTAPVGGLLDAAGLARAPAPGQWVAAGSLVATMTPGLAEGGGSYPTSRARFRAALEERARAKRLVEAEAAPPRRLREAEIALEAAREALAALGADQPESGRIALRAPIGGVLVDRQAVAGSMVPAGAVLFSIVDPTVVWLQARVPARLAADLSGKTRAAFTVDGEARAWSAGPLLSTGSVIDSVSRTVPLVFEVTNRDRSVRVGATARVFLERGVPIVGVVIPTSAIVEEDGRPTAYVQQEGELFQRRDLEIGGRRGDRVVVLGGLVAGERVVVGAAFQIRLASLSTAVPDHGHEH